MFSRLNFILNLFVDQLICRRTTHALKINYFCQRVGRASVVRQHSLLVRGARCTNATHIFVPTVIAPRKLGVFKILNAYKRINVPAMAEDRQQHLRRARTTLYQRQISLLCITWLPVEGARQSRATRLPCAACELEVGRGYTPAVRPALEQQAATMLFLQLNP